MLRRPRLSRRENPLEVKVLVKAKVKLKLKTHRGAAKRFKLTAGGKVIRRHAFARHILTSKARKRKRRLAKAAVVTPGDAAHVRGMLPYGR
jgi:large subunit ribosomal protein L35